MPLGSPRKAAGAFSEGGSYPTSGETLKLTSEALMALEREKGKYTGIERKRIDYQIRQAKRTLGEDD